MSSTSVVAVAQTSPAERSVTCVYSLTIFLAAFLLFQVELILSVRKSRWKRSVPDMNLELR